MLEAGFESTFSKRVILGNSSDYDTVIFRNEVRSLFCHYLLAFYVHYSVYMINLNYIIKVHIGYT